MRRAAQARTARLLHHDPSICVVDKPPRCVVGRGNDQIVGAFEMLEASAPQLFERPLLAVHRLDPDASGLVLYARDHAAQRALVGQFAAGLVQQTFCALVRGYVDADGVIDLNVYYDKRSGRLEASARRGKPASTHYRILERIAGNTWIECRAVVGRAAQIRAHLASIGHPLAIDSAFGNDAPIFLSRFKSNYRANRREQERPLVDRLTLHASRIECTHPHSGRRMTFESPPPKDLRATLRQLGRLA